MMNDPNSLGNDRLGPFLDRMIQYRNTICNEHALNVDHRHCIGCSLVMQHMQENFPKMVYGTDQQWIEEAAFCARHEREIFREFFRREQAGESDA